LGVGDGGGCGHGAGWYGVSKWQSANGKSQREAGERPIGV
jgi:hypothetical protein